MIRIIFATLMSLVSVWPATAHPRVWVKATSELTYAPDGSITGIRQHWMFDDMLSAFAVQGLQGKEGRESEIFAV